MEEIASACLIHVDQYAMAAHKLSHNVVDAANRDAANQHLHLLYVVQDK